MRFTDSGELYAYELVAEVASRFCAEGELQAFLQYQCETLTMILDKELDLVHDEHRLTLLREFCEALSEETLSRTSVGNFCTTLG